ncbi:class I SAM-dependent methyltransferase [Corallococcus sp. CA047B]|nr:class I SAM-dependent methyltransferase [Corallococcus sp. CA047B]
MSSHEHHHPRPFGPEHASHYDAGTNTGIAGYHAMHEVVAATMASTLKGNDTASVLSVGVGTGQELLPYTLYGGSAWRITGVDTSPHMLAVARERLNGAGLLARMQLHEGTLDGLPTGASFDGAQMVAVLHHVQGEATRLALLREVVRRLKPGAPFIIGDSFETDPVLMAAEEEFLRVAGSTPEKLAMRRKALATLESLGSDEGFFALLEKAGLTAPHLLFASLRFKVFRLTSSP